MIAKKVPMRSPSRSDYGYLVQYLTDKQGKHERLGRVWVTNCQSESWQAAVIEILNTQLQNTRAVSDKTCHLIVSFRAGEQPDDDLLKAIEGRFCDELGYREHQRVCVVHHDTDNLHVHFAINKIHPARHTIHDPYHDHWTLGKLCERLEREFGFEVDNHRASRTGSENRAADLERHAGVQSLLGWIQRECAEQMLQAKNWPELHAVMAGNGLKLGLRGNGLVITDGTGHGVKASSVARELSRTGLERRLGTFEPTIELKTTVSATYQGRAQPPPVGKIGSKPPPRARNVLRTLSQLEALKTGDRRYQPKPMRSRCDTTTLFTCYQDQQQKDKAARTAEMAKLAERKECLIESARNTARLKRDGVRAVKGTRTVKRVFYGVISSKLKEEIRKIHRQCAAERQSIDEKYPWRTWADWLRARAVEGDQEALAALRARDAACRLKGDTITGKGSRCDGRGAAQPDCITKKGTIIYHVGSTAVRDDGNRLKVSRGCTLEGVQAALCLAMEHYGGCIAVNGTKTFKEQVARAAVAGSLPLTFADAALERQRQELSESEAYRAKTNGQNREQSEGPGGRSAEDTARRGTPDPVLRRDVLRPEGIADGQTAADKYIAEREAMRLKVSGVPRHRRYEQVSDGDSAAFAGIRQVEGQMLALLKRGEEVMVLPVGAGTARRLKRVAIGEAVTVTAKGSVVARAGGRRV